jgi:hypothetical protein
MHAKSQFRDEDIDLMNVNSRTIFRTLNSFNILLFKEAGP